MLIFPQKYDKTVIYISLFSNQDRPYLCGQCGLTFCRSEHLHHHIDKFHMGMFDSPDEAPSGILITQDTSSPSKSVPSRSLVTAHTTEQYFVHIPGEPLISMAQSNVTMETSQVMALPRHVATSSAAVISPVTVTTPQSSMTVNEVMLSSPTGGKANEVLLSVPEENVIQIHNPVNVPATDDPTRHPGTDGDVERLNVSGVDTLQLQTITAGETGEVVELDLNDYELQECVERGADGQERTIYMLVVPEGKLPNITQPHSILHDNLPNSMQSLSNPSTAQGQTHPIIPQRDIVTQHYDSRQEGTTLIGGYGEPCDSTIKPEPGSSHQQEISPHDHPEIKLQSAIDYEIQPSDELEIKTETNDSRKKWKVVHMTDDSMSMSPIFDNDDAQEAQ